MHPEQFLRKAGYTYNAPRNNEKASFIRKVSEGNYPRYHIYTKEEDNIYILNLHLDQKKASYKGESAHSAEYDSKIIEDEIERIKNVIINLVDS